MEHLAPILTAAALMVTALGGIYALWRKSKVAEIDAELKRLWTADHEKGERLDALEVKQKIRAFDCEERERESRRSGAGQEKEP